MLCTVFSHNSFHVQDQKNREYIIRQENIRDQKGSLLQSFNWQQGHENYFGTHSYKEGNQCIKLEQKQHFFS